MANSRKDSKGRVLRTGEAVRSNGLYQYSYTDPYGKRRYIYAKTLVKLRQKEDELIRDRLDGIHSYIARDLSLNDLFDKYMNTRKDLGKTTYAGYMYQYNTHVRSSFGKRNITTIKYSDVLQFYKSLMEKKELSYGTIEHLQRELHLAFEMAVRDCLIRTNPTPQILGQLKQQTKVKRSIRKALTPEQQKAFLQFMDGHPVYDHWKPLFTFMIGTGVRVGEFSGLRWEDVDLKNGYITIDHAMIYFAGKMNPTEQRTYISKPKTEAGIRKIPIVPEVRKALDEVKQYQYENGIFCRTEIDGYTNFIFLNRFGNVYLQQTLDRTLARIIDAYNDMELHDAAKKKRNAVLLPHFTCHVLRHTFCARLCEHETNLKIIQLIMGHIDIGTTMNIYAEVSEERKKESMDSLADKLMLF